MKRKRAKPVYKPYRMGQIMLLPVNLDELIPANHLVRVVNEFVERMDLSALEAKYVGGGTSSYHPKMMLKVYLFAYTQKIFSSRRIAKALRENIYFMWLSGNSCPDFRTINLFRGRILKGLIEDIFVSLLVLLVEEGLVDLQDYFVDGTKMEANANRYTYVWAKNTERYDKLVAEKVKLLFEQIEQLNVDEDNRYGNRDLEEVGESGSVTEEKLSQQVNELNKRLKPEVHAPSELVRKRSENEDEAGLGQERPEDKDKKPPSSGGQPSLPQQIEEKIEQGKEQLEKQPANKALAKAVRELEKEYLPRAKKYELQRKTLAGRNSYSKTDPDATFMRMKDDCLGKGQPKAAYNIQNGTQNQFVVSFSLHQQAGDTTCLLPHLEQLKQKFGQLPENMIGDAAYGSEENYAYLEQNRIGNYLKYNTFNREQKKKYRPDPYQIDNMPYDAEQDQFTCPNGKRLIYQSTSKIKTRNHYPTERRIYECEDCQDCPLKSQCTKAKGNRKSKVSFQLWAYREQARQNLLSEKGVRLRSQRGVDVETVFGRIKECWGFRRFLLRGLEKVSVEWGILCMAHNLAKVFTARESENLAAI
jgi:transposase